MAYGLNGDRKQIGFWKKEGKESYLSSPLGYTDGKPVRMTIWQNFNRNEDTNQPYFFGLVNNHFDFDEDVYGDELDTSYKDLLRMQELVEELADVMRQGNSNADHMMLPSESRARMNELFEEAYRIIEELTGEKWNFTCLTW